MTAILPQSAVEDAGSFLALLDANAEPDVLIEFAARMARTIIAVDAADRARPMMCEHRSRGGSVCLGDQGHYDPAKQDWHSDTVILWDAEGYLVNLNGSRY